MKGLLLFREFVIAWSLFIFTVIVLDAMRIMFLPGEMRLPVLRWLWNVNERGKQRFLRIKNMR